MENERREREASTWRHRLDLIKSALSDQRPKPLRPRAPYALRRPEQQLVCVGRRQCAAEEKALGFVAVVLLQEQQLRKALDALGGDIDPQRSGHGDDGG